MNPLTGFAQQSPLVKGGLSTLEREIRPSLPLKEDESKTETGRLFHKKDRIAEGHDDPVNVSTPTRF